jgi:hypothetical protein
VHVCVLCACCVCVCVFFCPSLRSYVIRMFIKWTSGGAERAAYVRTVLNVRTFRVMVDGRLITVVPLGTVD